MLAQNLHKPRLFLDANIFVAAALSPSGGSFRLLQESHYRNIHLFANQYAHDEACEAIQNKYPLFLTRLEQLVLWSGTQILKDPSVKAVAEYMAVINEEDAPILAGAISAKAQFLVTLDRRDFMSETFYRIELPFHIVTPGDFFQKYYSANHC